MSNKKCYSLGSPVARELNHKLATGVKGVKPPVTNLLPLAGLEPACHVRRGILSPLCIPIPPEWRIYYIMCYTCAVKSYNLGDIVMHSTTDISGMVKQANILARLARGAGGAIKAAPKGALIGGALGVGATLPFAGLAAGLGAGGAGLFSGAMLGASTAGGISGLRSFLKSPAKKLLAPSPIVSEGLGMAAHTLPNYARPALARAAFNTGSVLPAVAVGGGLGYALSDRDSKLLGTTIGVVGGLAARPAVMRALAVRSGRL